MIRKILIIAALISAPTFMMGQTRVTSGVMQGKEYGVTYTLPKTKIELTVDAVQEVYTPGEFSKYASSYLHLEDVRLNPYSIWKINNVEVASIGVPDSDKVFFVRMRDRTVAPLMELTNEGIIKTINVPFENKREPIKEKDSGEKPLPNPKNYFTEEILMANSTAKMAELVSQEIYLIRESKNSLLRGEAENTPQDGEQLKLMLNNLEEQEASLTSLFTGHTQKIKQVFKVAIEPTQEFNDTVICRFSKRLGVVESDDLSGEPITLSLKNLNSIEIPEDNRRSGRRVDGIAYNIPGTAEIVVSFGGREVAKGNLPITQFGGIEYLAPALFNKRSKIQAYFDPNTGGLLKVDQADL